MIKLVIFTGLILGLSGCVGAISKHNYKLNDIERAERIYRGVGVVYGATKAVIKKEKRKRNAKSDNSITHPSKSK